MTTDFHTWYRYSK